MKQYLAIGTELKGWSTLSGGGHTRTRLFLNGIFGRPVAQEFADLPQSLADPVFVLH
jgi:hypothetical protein